MKKSFLIISILLVLVLAFSLSACGEQSLNAKFALSAMSDGDQEYAVDMLKIAMGENYSEENFVQFNSDNTFIFTMMGSTVNGTYKKSKSEITMTSKENDTFGVVVGTIEGENFVVEDEGLKMTFTKAKAEKE